MPEHMRRLAQPALWLVLLALAAVPLIRPAIPPLLDLPGHMGGYAIALHHGDGSALDRYFDHHWQVIGNLGVELLMQPLGAWIGIEGGTKLVVLLIPILTTLGFLMVAREGHDRMPATALFALPFAYSYPFHYGFVNYCLGMALAMLAFALWMRLADEERWIARTLLFAVIAPAIWLAHAVAWILLCVACGTEELWRRRTQSAGWPAALRQTMPQVLVLGVPLLLMPLSPHGAPLSIGGVLQPASIVKWIVALNRDRWIAFDMASTATVLLVIVAAATGRAGLRFAPRLAWPAAALFALYLVAPQSINGSDYVGARIVPFAVALALLAIRDEPARGRRRWIALAAVAFLLARTAATTASFWLYDNSYRTALAALDRVPAGSRIAAFSPQGCAPGLRYWANPRLQHLGSIAIVRREAYTNDQWTIDGLQLVRTRYLAAAPLLGEPSEVVTLEPCARSGVRYLPDAIAAVPRGAFDYVWLLGIPPAHWPHAAWLMPIYRSDQTVLFKIARGARR